MRALQKTKEKLTRGIQQLIGYAKISSSTAKQDLSATITDGEVAEKLPFFQTYGIKSRPKGGIAIAVNVGGNRDDQAIIAILPEGPDDLEEGEVVLYIDDGDEIRIKKDEIKIKSKKLSIDSDDVAITGELIVAGAIKSKAEITAKYDTSPVNLSTHPHPTGVGPSGPPTVGV